MAPHVTHDYNGVSTEYPDIVDWDWDAVMRQEGASLDRFLAKQVGRPGPYSLLDCSCGIGTQAIGLALQGHQVHATDLSTVSIDCARNEATKHDIDIDFAVADFRKLGETVAETFDVVLSCDNSIAHCLKDEDLDAALASMKSRLNPGGLLLISLRDYDALVVHKPHFNNDHVHDRPDGRRIVFQVWDWSDDGRQYPNTQFLLKETDGSYEVKHFETELRALLREQIIAARQSEEYEDATWHVPEESGYYQPIVTARNK